MSVRTLTEILQGWDRDAMACECIRALDELPAEDLARSSYEAAAQTFALLAIRDAIFETIGGER